MPMYHIYVITWALLIDDYDITKFLSCMHHKITPQDKIPWEIILFRNNEFKS